MGNLYLAQNLTQFRERSNLTQQQVADVVGLKRSTYAYYENGKTEPKHITLQKLAKMYNVTTDDLYGTSENIVLNAPMQRYDNGSKIADSIAQLSPFEQSILLKLRLMTMEQKEELIKFIEKSDI